MSGRTRRSAGATVALALAVWLTVASSPAGRQRPAGSAETQQPVARIVLVPVDDRPVNLQDIRLAARTAGVEVVVPPRSRLGGRVEDGDADGIAEWLDGLELASTDAVVVSIDMLAYGGVPASRRAAVTQAKALDRLKAVERLAARRPGLPVYAVDRLLRLAPAPQPRREAVLAKVERWAALAGATNPAELTERDRLREELPGLVLDPYLATRARDKAVTLAALDLTAKGVIRHLTLESDEEPRGLAVAERAEIEARRAQPDLEDRTALVSATDGIAGLIVARALDGTLKSTATVHVEGGGEGVRMLVSLAGARLVESAAANQMTLLVAAPASAGAAEDAAERARRLLESGARVAIADVGGAADHGGASIPLVEGMRNRHLFPRLLAYAAEGAGDRTVAAALYQGLFASAGLDIASARGASPGLGPQLAAARTLATLHRLVVDFAYQAIARPEAEGDYAQEHKIDPEALDADQVLRMQEYLAGEVKPLAESLVSDFAASATKSGRHAGRVPLTDIDGFTLTLPWRTLADPEIRFTLVEH